MKKPRLSIYPYLMLLLWWGLSTNTQAQTTHPSVDSLIQVVLKQQNIPAMAVAVVRPDTTHYGIGGTNKTKEGSRVQLSHKFHLGSNTKAVTSLMAMKLIEEGKVSLDTRFFRYFPKLKRKANKAYWKMTLGELLSHQAGIAPYTSGFAFKLLPELGTELAVRKVNFAKAVLKDTPVEQGTYSNAGYVLAGLLMAKVADKSYEELLAETMKALALDYALGAPNKETTANPWGHWSDGGGALIAHGPDHVYQLEDFMLPAGDLSMNVVDYAALVQLHLQGLTGKDNYLKASHYQRLHFGLENYSYGWGNDKSAEHPVSYHDGSLGTFYAHTIMIPKLEIAIIVLTNSAEKIHVAAIYQLREQLVKLHEQF